MSEIYLAGGCFWGMEKYIALIQGVKETQVGYANGAYENPTYEQVCRENTGHAETVRVVYEPSIVSLPFLLELYFEAIDPTSLNRQGGDIGTQYRTGIYYTDAADLPVIQRSLSQLQARVKQPVAIEVKPMEQFSLAEEYHQNYLEKNPNGYCHIGSAAFQRAAKAGASAAPYVAPAQKELQKALTPEQLAVTQNAATEPPFHNAYWNTFEPGIYVDITTGQPLFASSDKFDAGCGWPSFTRPIAEDALEEHTDTSHGMVRTEVKSRFGHAHLGHVFDDGPEEGGLRYCMNSAALRFIPKSEMEKSGYGAYLKFVKEV